VDLVERAAANGLDVDGWTIMPFDFEQGETDTDMVAATESAVDALADLVADTYALSTSAAYQKVGFSSMNGNTDSDGETVTVADFEAMCCTRPSTTSPASPSGP